MKTPIIYAALIAASSALPAHAWCVDGKMENIREATVQVNEHTFRLQKCTINFNEDCYDLTTSDSTPPSLDSEEGQCAAFLALMPDLGMNQDEVEFGYAMQRYVDAMRDFVAYAK